MLGLHSVLDPAGPAAAHIARLWWVMFWTMLVVTIAVLAMVGVAVWRGRRPGAPREHEVEEKRLTRAVGGAVAATVVILFVFLVLSIWTGRVNASMGAASAVTISVTGHQFWWEIEYEDAQPNRRVTTANEIHIPVGRPIALKVTSRDVIHSFWVPNLQGKRDLIPGIMTAIWLQADRPGVYRGQCAEFCGRQHAHMGFTVVAEPEDAFERWLDDERRSAADPAGEAQQRGRDVFLKGQCVLCHTVRGTPAQGRVGPDLTHIAHRQTIGAGTLPNTRGHLAGWVLDPQTIKPGTLMPPNVLTAAQLEALLAYLESLS
jgi:cytochrome c oxidase subunit 2